MSNGYSNKIERTKSQRPSLSGNGVDGPEPEVQAAVDKGEIPSEKDGLMGQFQILMAVRWIINFVILRNQNQMKNIPLSSVWVVLLPPVRFITLTIGDDTLLM